MWYSYCDSYLLHRNRLGSYQCFATNRFIHLSCDFWGLTEWRKRPHLYRPPWSPARLQQLAKTTCHFCRHSCTAGRIGGSEYPWVSVVSHQHVAVGLLFAIYGADDVVNGLDLEFVVDDQLDLHVFVGEVRPQAIRDVEPALPVRRHFISWGFRKNRRFQFVPVGTLWLAHAIPASTIVWPRTLCMKITQGKHCTTDFRRTFHDFLVGMSCWNQL